MLKTARPSMRLNMVRLDMKRRFRLWWLVKSTAIVLWGERLKAGLSLVQAAKAAGLEPKTLSEFELGLKSPPACLIPRLLDVYGSSYEACLFFCMTKQKVLVEA
jgi:predicted transcriptional regulator